MANIKRFLNQINWKVRIKNKQFWISMIPLVIVLVYRILVIFGIEFDYTLISEQIIQVVEAIFVILGVLGIVNDPTTEGFTDSDQALTYITPKAKIEVTEEQETSGE